MREVAGPLLAIDHGDARRDRARLDREDDAQHDHREGGPLDARARDAVELGVRMVVRALARPLGEDGDVVGVIRRHDGRRSVGVMVRVAVVVIVVVMPLVRLGLPVVRVAVRQRRRGRGEAGRQGEDAGDEAGDDRAWHECKLPWRLDGGNRVWRPVLGQGQRITAERRGSARYLILY